MSRELKEEVVTFRVTLDEWRRIAKCGLRAGRSANEWCRDLALSESAEDFGMTANERILLEELGVQRKLLGEVLERMLTPEELEELREVVDQDYVEYGRQLLEKRSGSRMEGVSDDIPEVFEMT
jgi:hypothetical protein